MPSPDPRLRDSNRRARIVFLSISGVGTVLLVALAREVLLPFVFALVVAYVLTPAVRFAERLRLPRWVAVILVYVVTLGGLYASIAAMAPRLGGELAGLVHDAPAIVKKVQEEQLPSVRKWLGTVTGSAQPPPSADAAGEQPSMRINPRPDGSYDVALGPGIDVHQVGEGHWRIEQSAPPDRRPFDLGRFTSEAVSKAIAYGQRNTLEVIALGRSIVSAVSRTIFVFFMTLMLAAYLMITRERIVEFFRSLVAKDSRRSFDLLLARTDRGLSGVVRGQLLICLVNGVLSAIGFSIFGLKYWPVLAVLAGVMSLVPIFGSILSSIPIVALALTQSFGTAVEVLLWILGIHQLEANLLNPKIIGDAAKIHPVLVVFSLLVGEHFFRLPGALLAVPVLSIVQSLFLHFRAVTYEGEGPPDSFAPPREPV